MLLIVCYQIVRHAIQPLEQLDYEAQRIAEGRFDTDLTESPRQDSVGRLQNSFIRMQQSLATSVNDIRSVNAELEQRNEELTRAYQLQLDTNREKAAFIQKMDGVAVSIEQAYEVGTSSAVSDRYSSYSAWTADLNSSLMREAREVWKSLFGTEMKLVRVGGGMETSNFAVSYPSMQIFTFGPNVSDAHTVNEHVEISSIDHAWTYLLELLRKI